MIWIYKLLLVIVITAGLFIYYNYAWAEESADVSVAILQFNNLTKDASVDNLKNEFQSNLGVKLSNTPTIKIVEKSKLEDALNSMKLTTPGQADVKTLTKLGNLTGVKYVLVGSFIKSGDMVKIYFRKVNVAKGESTKGICVIGSYSNLAELQERFAKTVIANLLGNITGSDAAPSLQININRPVIKSGKDIKVTAIAHDKSGKPVDIEDGIWKWSSSNPSVAIVEADGNTAIIKGGSAGKANITVNVTVPTKTTRFEVNVYEKLISDPELEAAIRKKLKKSQEDLTLSDLEGMKGTLDAIHSQITNLTGLEYCTNLAGLNLGGNNISDLKPLADLTNLKYLNLNYNQVRDLTPLSGLVNLNYLEMNYNKISDLKPLGGLSKLTYLEANNNLIGDLTPVTGLTKLKELYLTSNQIRDITPLVNNQGLGSGDSVCLMLNPLDTNQNSKTGQDIKILKERGAAVFQ